MARDDLLQTPRGEAVARHVDDVINACENLRGKMRRGREEGEGERRDLKIR
jgi:hypothetical protein